MPTKQLPPRPSLVHLKHQAKDLLKAHKAGKLSEAQHLIACEYGFESWPKLKKYVESLACGFDPSVNAFIEAAVAGKQAEAKKILAGNPSLPRANIYTAAILGEAGIVEEMLKRDPKLATHRGGPKNWDALLYASFSRFHGAGLVRVAKLLLAHGADPNTSYSWEQDEKNKLPALWAATSESNNPALARVLLEAGANPDDGESVYHAAQLYHVECLELLLKFGANLSGPFQPWNNTPLFFLLGHKPSSGAAEQAFKGIRWLLEHGADPDAPSYEHESRPVHLAASNGWRVEMFELLLKHGADLRVQRKDGVTAYALALRHGHAHAADWLRQHDAETKLSPADEFFAACGRKDEPAVRAIMAGHPDFARSLANDDKRLMLDAAWDGKTEAVRLMLLAGIPIDFRGADDATALHFASLSGHSETVRMLLAHNSSLEIKDKTYHATPLGWAVWGSQNDMNPKGDYPATVEALLAAGAATWEGISGSDAVNKVLLHRRLNKTKPADFKAFWSAMRRGDTDKLGKLVAAGVDVNEPWPIQEGSAYANLFTPLLAAVSTGNIAVAKCLLDHGADVNGGSQWMTPVLWAAARRHDDIVKLLQKHGAKETIFVAAALGRTDHVTAYLREDPRLIEQRDEHGQTVMHYAAQALRAKVVAVLLQRGADVNAVDALGSTPLHILCDVRLADPAEQLAVLRLLLDAGANVNALANHNVAPLHRAVRARNPVAVKLLLEHGAVVDARDDRGSTPLRRAVSNTGAGGTAGSRAEAIEIIKLLIQAGANPLSKNREGKTVLASTRDVEFRRLLKA